METVAIVLSLLGTAFMLAYIGNQFKSSSDGGSKYASVMKLLFNVMSFFTVMTVPIAGLAIAESISISGLADIMGISFVPIGFLMIVFVFYLIWEYLSDLIRIVSGADEEFETDELK